MITYKQPQVIDADIETCNGIIHIIDKVMLPEDIDSWVPAIEIKEPTAAPTEEEVDDDKEPTTAPTDSGDDDEEPTTAPTDTGDDDEEPTSAPTETDNDEPDTCQTIGM
jgi:Fasciclin domain